MDVLGVRVSVGPNIGLLHNCLGYPATVMTMYQLSSKSS